MTIQIRVPELGESVLEATVGRWLKKEGDRVEVGDVLVELETEKVNLEVGAEQAGVLAHILRQEGEDVQIGDVLGEIETTATEEAPEQEKIVEHAAPVTVQNIVTEAQTQDRVDGERATSVATRMAREQGVDLAQVHGTGPSGRVTKSDVESYVAQQQQTAQPLQEKVEREPAPISPVSADRREERMRMSRRRRTIARRLVEAQHAAAMLTTFNEIDMSAVVEIRKRRKEDFKQRHGVNLGFTSFFVKASIGALKSFPRLNAEIDGDDIVLKHYYDIGIAVGAEEGLVVPVLRDADRLSFAEIETRVKTFAEKAQAGTLSIDDLRGGTFTITNGGVFGSMLSTPILNPPQVGILGLHKIEERPIAHDGQVIIRPMMYVALSYDHRIVDGREAVQFLVRVKELIEDSETLLLEG